jgi:outer membrane immunogenic protein
MKLLLGTTMIAGLMIASAAQAADMPLKAPPRAYAPEVGDWTGFYIGVHGGYGWGKAKPDDFDIVDLTDAPFHNPKPKGGVFGGHAGYNWQKGRFVGGLEIDYSFAKLKETQSFSYQFQNCPEEEDCFTDTFSRTLRTKVDALASARARAGFLVTDSLLAYGTAGIGWARSQATATFSDTVESDPITLTAKSNNFGWVAGGGLEYKLTQNLLLRGEYLHYDFGSVGYAFQPIVTINANLKVDVARGGLSFKF